MTRGRADVSGQVRNRLTTRKKDWKWFPTAKLPPEKARILIRFYIRENAENVEYVLAGHREGNSWVVKAPWDARGINVRHCVLATHWSPMPREWRP